MRGPLPGGTVTLLFTDVEGSTRLLAELGPEAYAAALHEHRRALRTELGARGGIEVDTQGDAFFYAFPDARAAVAAAAAGQEALRPGRIRVRMGLHTGRPLLTAEGYIGDDVHLGARIGAAGHGGQVLLSAATRALVDADVVELGEHRLKDFPQPVPIFQLGSERFPPLKTLSSTNLPRPASSFVGRGREVREVAELLRDGRLVTLTGPGGSGKTRLALEAAAELVGAFKAGVFWVGLAPVRDPALVVETIAETLGAQEELAGWIGARELLLLLDNLEQVVDAAPALAALVEACPNLRLLVTSRELLRVRGEAGYPVPPLAEPDAVELFASRAGLEPDGTIAELCRRLDNLPLALELAAARTAVLSPARILDRLGQRLDLLRGGRDAVPRQQTLRATIAWSYDLLAPDERLLFARLAVCRGGATLEAAEAIADADVDLLQALVDKSLLRHTGERFWMLESIREFAGERLEEAGEGERLRRRHAEHYLMLAEEAFPHLQGGPGPWLGRLDAERDNLRAALDRLEETDPETALRLAGALYRFWYMHGHLREGRERLERLLARCVTAGPARARALQGAAVMLANSGEPAAARARSEESLTLHRALGDDWGVAYATFLLGLVATEESAWSRARPLFEGALERFRALGDGHYALLAGDGLAWTAGELGEREERRRLHEQVLRDAQEQGDRSVAAAQLEQLAQLAGEEGRGADALALMADALETKRDLDMPSLIVESLCRLAAALADAGRPDGAARLVGAACALREEIGGGFAWVGESIAATQARLRTELGEAALEEELARGRRLAPAEAVGLALELAAAARRGVSPGAAPG